MNFWRGTVRLTVRFPRNVLLNIEEGGGDDETGRSKKHAAYHRGSGPRRRPQPEGGARRGTRARASPGASLGTSPGTIGTAPVRRGRRGTRTGAVGAPTIRRCRR